MTSRSLSLRKAIMTMDITKMSVDERQEARMKIEGMLAKETGGNEAVH